MTTSENTTPPTTPEKPGQSYWDLVWGQFRKNRLALWSAVAITVGILLIAAWAPVLANGKPFVWVQNGKTSYPLFQYLVAPREKISVDHLFNYFLFLSITLTLILVPVWRSLKREGLSEGTRRQRLKFACLGAVRCWRSFPSSRSPERVNAV